MSKSLDEIIAQNLTDDGRVESLESLHEGHIEDARAVALAYAAERWEWDYIAIRNLVQLRTANLTVQDLHIYPCEHVPDEIVQLRSDAANALAIVQEYFTAEVDRLSNPEEHNPDDFDWRDMLEHRRTGKRPNPHDDG